MNCPKCGEATNPIVSHHCKVVVHEAEYTTALEDKVTELEAKLKEKDEEIEQYRRVTYGESKYNDVGLSSDQNYLAFVLGNFVNFLENKNYKIAMLRKAIEPFVRNNKDYSLNELLAAKRAYEETK